MTCRRQLVLFLFLIILSSCNQEGNYSNIVYPKGGYNYPKHVEEKSKDFPYYPLRDSMSVRDSFYAVWFGRIFLPAYKEPNMSIAPTDEDLFRFFVAGPSESQIIISLRPHEIIVKTNGENDIYGSPFPDEDTTKLNELEKFHFEILSHSFPIPEKILTTRNPARKRYLDSLISAYPELASTGYYFQLFEKLLVPKKGKFVYTEEHIPITTQQYHNWIALLNNSEYWHLPYTLKCNSSTVVHGIGYTMEASTKEKYNSVQWTSCPGDTSNFSKACDSLAKLAHMEKRVHVVWAE